MEKERSQWRDIVFSICSAVDQQSAVLVAQQLRPDDPQSLEAVASLLRNQERVAPFPASATGSDGKSPGVDSTSYDEAMPPASCSSVDQGPMHTLPSLQTGLPLWLSGTTPDAMNLGSQWNCQQSSVDVRRRFSFIA